MPIPHRDAILGALLLLVLGLAGRSDRMDAELLSRITAERNHQVMREYSRAWVECLQGVEQYFDDGRQLWVVPCDTYVVRVAQ